MRASIGAKRTKPVQANSRLGGGNFLKSCRALPIFTIESKGLAIFCMSVISSLERLAVVPERICPVLAVEPGVVQRINCLVPVLYERVIEFVKLTIKQTEGLNHSLKTTSGQSDGQVRKEPYDA